MNTRPTTQSVMGIPVIFHAPSDIPSLIEWFGSETQVLQAGIKQAAYHGFSPACREGFAKACGEKFPDFPRKQATKNGAPQFKEITEEDEAGNEVKKQVPILETEQEYYNRLLAAGLLTKEAAAVIMQAVADTVDPRPKSTSGRKPTKKSLEDAAQLLAQWSAGISFPEEFRTKWESLNATAYPFAGAEAFSVDNVARALLINKERVEREAQGSFM